MRLAAHLFLSSALFSPVKTTCGNWVRFAAGCGSQGKSGVHPRVHVDMDIAAGIEDTAVRCWEHRAQQSFYLRLYPTGLQN